MIKKRNKIYIFIFITFFLVFFILQKGFNIKPNQYVHDVSTYYNLSKSLFINNRFSLLTIENDFRGFVFPVYLFISVFFNYLFNLETSFYFVSSFILAILFSVYVFLFVELFVYESYNNKNIYFRSLFMIVMILFFFYGLVIWPFTDLYAALLSLIAGMLILYTNKKNKNKFRYIVYFISGVLIYFAYNIRTIYQVQIISFIFMILIYEIKTKKIKNTMSSILCYISGVLIASIPQIIINFNNYGLLSIWVNNQNLFALQLRWGLSFSRYATYIGDVHKYHYIGMYFFDWTGMIITKQWKILGYPLTIKSYILLFFKYPIEYIKVFIKHAVNAIFILFPEQYVQNIDKNLLIYGVISVIVVFLFILIFFVMLNNKKINLSKVVFWVLMILPSLMILFGAVEERFVVLIYIVVYSYICFFDYSSLKKYINRTNVILVLVLFIIFFILAFNIESRILANLNGHPLYFFK